MSFIASAIHPGGRGGTEQAKQIWAVAEQRFGDGEWALGRNSVVDIHLFRLYWRFVAPSPAEFGTLPRLAAHYSRMMARPAVRKTIEIENEIRKAAG